MSGLFLFIKPLFYTFASVKNLVFLFVAFFMVLRPIIPIVDYGINYNFIVKELCENKEKPELQCNGKCHLAKELAKASENEKPISQEKKHQTSEIEVLYFNHLADYNFTSVFYFSQHKINSLYMNLYKGICSDSTFHPPTLFV